MTDNRKQSLEMACEASSRRVDGLELVQAQLDAITGNSSAQLRRCLAGRLWRFQHNIDEPQAQIADHRHRPTEGLAGQLVLREVTSRGRAINHLGQVDSADHLIVLVDAVML